MEKGQIAVLFLFAMLASGGCRDGQATGCVYTDGSGNVYRLFFTNGPALEYVPVEPQKSSSGAYSGGAPATVNLTEAQFERITALLRGAVSNKEIRAETRVMLSGMIEINDGRRREAAIIKPGAKELELIESALKEALQR